MPANPPTLPPEIKRHMIAAHCAALLATLREMAARQEERTVPATPKTRESAAGPTPAAR